MPRLPVPGSDDGTWGNILNEYLSVEHNSDGTLKASGSLASKADDSAVVHLSGSENITGSKTFASSPTIPAPTLGSHAATRTYVDTAAGNHTVSSQSGNYAITTTDEIILANASGGGIALTLPTAVGNSRVYTIKKTDASANTVTITTTGGQTIDGGASAVLQVQYESVSLVSNNANWFVI